VTLIELPLLLHGGIMTDTVLSKPVSISELNNP
jgi:hypothetical protein